MKTFLFFGYREWAMNIFKHISSVAGDNWVLVSDKRSCTKDFIDKLNPSIVFFYGWSWLVSKDITDNYFCVCLHPSPLPKYRGGSPIQNQVLAGETESAVTLFKMGDGIDDGNILYQDKLWLWCDLSEILKDIEEVGIRLTWQLLQDYEWDYIKGTPQNEAEATYYKRRKPEDSEINPSDFKDYDAKYFYDLVRVSQPPYPEAFVECRDGKLILEKVRYEI
jgi:methionyl-tRNA formyltransferase